MIISRRGDAAVAGVLGDEASAMTNHSASGLLDIRITRGRRIFRGIKVPDFRS